MKKNMTERATSLIVRAVCLLLIAVSLLSVTFARYITTSSPDPSIGVSPFAYSFSVDTTNTGYVFDNADYKHENLVMNTPQITPFTVSNAETRDGKEVVAGVDIRFSVVFYVPELFAQCAALQITTDDSETAVTPLYLLEAFLQDAPYTTSGGYGSIGGIAEQTFGAPAGGVFTATDGSTVKVEKVSLHSSYTLSFYTYDGTMQMPALFLDIEEEVNYYKFTISNAKFYLPANAKTEQTYQLRLVPARGMSDVSGGGVIIDHDFEKSFDTFLSYVSADGSNLHLGDTLLDWDLTWDNANKQIYLYHKDKPDDQTLVSVGKCMGKRYPSRLGGLFWQASEAK